MSCDLVIIICDPEWSDAQPLRDVPHKACVTLFIAVKLFGRIINTVRARQLDKKRIEKIAYVIKKSINLPLGRVPFVEM